MLDMSFGKSCTPTSPIFRVVLVAHIFVGDKELESIVSQTYKVHVGLFSRTDILERLV